MMRRYIIGERKPERFIFTRRKGGIVPIWAWLALGAVVGILVDRVIL